MSSKRVRRAADNPADMGQPFERKYSQEQFSACFDARFARGLTYPRIVELAESGELIAGEPFTIDVAYLGDKCRAEARRRQGKAPSAVAALAPVDAVEHMRKRLVALVESELNVLALEKNGKRDPKRLSDLARVVREIAAIPGVKDPRPERAAGSNTPGVPRVPDAPRSGPVGALLQSFRVQAQNAETPAGEAGASTSNESAAA